MRCSVRTSIVGVLGVLFAASVLMAAAPSRPTSLRPTGTLSPTALTPLFEWSSSGATWCQIWVIRDNQDSLRKGRTSRRGAMRGSSADYVA